MLFSPFPSIRSSFSVNATPPTEIYTLSLHDALPICVDDGGADVADRGAGGLGGRADEHGGGCSFRPVRPGGRQDRKSTRLNSSHLGISYAVFCLKKKKKNDRKRPAVMICCLIVDTRA